MDAAKLTHALDLLVARAKREGLIVHHYPAAGVAVLKTPPAEPPAATDIPPAAPATATPPPAQ